MCVKIICTDHEHEFNPSEPLENQIMGAKEIVLNYDPYDLKIGSFVEQIESMVKNGISCKVDIKVNANNLLDGIKLERQLEKLKLKLDINEVTKGLTTFHSDIDRRLGEIQEICLGKMNE